MVFENCRLHRNERSASYNSDGVQLIVQELCIYRRILMILRFVTTVYCFDKENIGRADFK